METEKHPSAATLANWERKPAAGVALTPLANEPRATLPTLEAAAHLGRKPQTLRGWACHEDGPLRPLRVNGRLAWPVAQIRQLVGA